jgi:hypothetical protein
MFAGKQPGARVRAERLEMVKCRGFIPVQAGSEPVRPNFDGSHQSIQSILTEIDGQF